MAHETNPIDVVCASGAKKESSYIVHLKASVDMAAHLQWLRQRLSGDSEINDDYSFMNAFSGKFNEQTLAALRASSDVERIEEDAEISLFSKIVQGPAPWGLNRISQRPWLKFEYTYIGASNPVDIYIVDTGIFTSHIEFGSRASWGYTYKGLPNVDDNGHGTQVASVAGGTHAGVFKNAHLIAVKVLDAKGNGSVTATLAGIAYIMRAVQASRRPSVVNFSLGFYEPDPTLISLDKAIAKMTDAGIHVCAASGNNNVNAGLVSPARAPSAVTVGASNMLDRRWHLSNYGAVLNIFAPGENIQMATIGDRSATIYSSGTSFACPHLAGLIAYTISLRGNQSPSAMSQYLKSTALANVLGDIPAGTPNFLANNGF
ncbi:serine proteinase [Dichomitus squalens]|uniref:Serine proteinase n=1 Tax=Dichomitus squalens TaxID=114155 RepID=A0A4Q9N9E6_9APHY|nr:serine proteinase [Dichomitus squalens]TBU52223.1 serine proteinase [Dichomitus squalens]